MKTKIVLASFFIVCSHLLIVAQSYPTLIRKGVQYFEREQFDQAEIAFREALSLNEQGFEAHYNLGNTLYRQGRYDEAQKAFAAATKLAPNRSAEAKALHNLGNTEVEQQKYKEAIDALKKSLLRNPSDEETRSNLAYAMRRLQEEQEQQQQKQDQQDGDQSNQDQDQNQENEQEQSDSQQEEQQGDSNEDSKQEQAAEGADEQESPTFDPEDAERIMQMIEDEENKVQEKLQDQERKKLKDNKRKKIW
jgi:Ca-activated chloride channel homolog